jgi:transaldolase
LGALQEAEMEPHGEARTTRPSKKPNVANALLARGQSVWLDFMTRDLVRTGALDRMVEVDGMRGQTSNPTIFEKAIASGTAYDEEIVELARHGAEARVIFEALAVTDVRDACDVFRHLYERTDGSDGFVSMEVAPELAHDASGSVEEARRLWREVDRPNLMIKIPGTDAGAIVTERLLEDGINVNITLLFSTVHHERVMQAHLGALERRLDLGRPIDRIASVASFFVSRVDTLVDATLEEKAALASAESSARMRALLGKVGIANARVAYANFRALYDGPRFARLAKAGARVQRPLWASTSTKNPKYRDVVYAESLIGPDTIDTMPISTLEALVDHGRIDRTVDQDLEGAKRTLDELEALGLDYGALTKKLEEEGIAAFAKSAKAAIAAVSAKMRAARV